ncbi:hypothetical protein D3C78_738280 [compost metagenome]
MGPTHHHPAQLGGVHTTVAAYQQSRAEEGFEFLNDLGDCRLGEVQGLRGTHQRAAAQYLVKDHQLIEFEFAGNRYNG